MRLRSLRAVAHPDGNRIDLAWQYPDPAPFDGVRVVRRAGSHPTSPSDGVLVAEGVGLAAAADTGLKGETVYYYTLFPFAGAPPAFDSERANRVAAMATAPYDSAGQLYELLPAIYRRYDAERGTLRRFLSLPGGQLDQLRSLARAALDLHDLDRVDGRLLPLLAQWVGWKTDHSQEIAAQRNEIRNAVALYRTTGLIANLEVTARRIIGRDSRTKEFVHNVLRANQPERLPLWALRRALGGAWAPQPGPLSLDAAHAGRPAAVRDGDGNAWLFYQAIRQGRAQIWYKRAPAGQDTWQASQPLSQAPQIASDPTAVNDNGALSVFWSAYDPASGRWSIWQRTRTPAGVWQAEQRFGDSGERRRPSAVADDAGGVWLFWLERDGDEWPLRYARHSGGAWSATVEFPRDAGQPPRVEADPFVLFHPVGGPPRRLWVFWARQEPAAAPGQTRWSIVYRSKANLNPDAGGWSAIRPIAPPPASFDECEPAAIGEAGDIDLFYSSNRSGSRSIWRNRLDVAADAWGAPEALTDDPYTQRAPVPLRDGDLWLFYRSNQSVTYPSQAYSATTTTDWRYAGSTSVDTGNAAKIALRGRFGDFQTYSYATGPGGQHGDSDLYARDSVGIYWDPNTALPELAVRSQQLDLVRQLLQAFAPIQARLIFIKDPDA